MLIPLIEWIKTIFNNYLLISLVLKKNLMWHLTRGRT